MRLSGLGGRLYRGETSLNIIGGKKKWYSVSLLFIILSGFALGTKGIELSIEFKGGSSFTVTTQSGTIAQAEEALVTAGYSGETRILAKSCLPISGLLQTAGRLRAAPAGASTSPRARRFRRVFRRRAARCALVRRQGHGDRGERVEHLQEGGPDAR